MCALKEITIDIYYDTNPIIDLSISDITFVQIGLFEYVGGFVGGWWMRMKNYRNFRVPSNCDLFFRNKTHFSTYTNTPILCVIMIFCSFCY